MRGRDFLQIWQMIQPAFREMLPRGNPYRELEAQRRKADDFQKRLRVNTPTRHACRAIRKAVDFGLDTPLLDLGGVPWRYEDAFRHTLCLGGTGSGKTSSVLREMFLAALEHGWGVLSLCVKPDDAAMYESLADEAGRTADVRVFGPGRARFAPLEYMRRHALPDISSPSNMAKFVSEVLEPLVQEAAKEEAFWSFGRREMLKHAFVVLSLAGQPIDFDVVADFIALAPKSRDEVDRSEQWRPKVFGQRFKAAERNATRGDIDLANARQYWLKTVPEMDGRLRDSVVMTTQVILANLQEPSIRQLCSGFDVTPEDALAGGKVVIVNIPTDTHPVAGPILTQMFKNLFRSAALRRSVPASDRTTRPCLLVMDEAQALLTNDDTQLLARARSARVSVLALTQSYDAIVTTLKGHNAQAASNALAANFATRVFLACDHNSAEWAAKQCGQSYGVNLSASERDTGFGRHGLSYSLQREDDIRPADFYDLRTGGHPDGEVDSITLLGRKAIDATGKPWMKLTWHQWDVTFRPATGGLRGLVGRWVDNHYAVRFTRWARQWF
jgi:type IV secretory pathway TraG/TraD family ATPase VirD4